MNRNKFWEIYTIPVQEDVIGFEPINPADAYRKQADAINQAGPIHAELEVLEARLHRVETIETELKRRILAQNMPLPSSSTRTTELVEAYILHKAEEYLSTDGTIKDVSGYLSRLHVRRAGLQRSINKLQKRLRALQAMAEKCDSILNWAKYEGRLHSGLQR